MSESATTPGPRTDRDWVFRYGYRLVKREVRPGRLETVEVPLTREQYLHPQEEDRFMVKPRHVTSAKYVAGVFESVMNGRPGAVVLMEVDVDFGHGVKPLRPDVSVFLDSRPLDIHEGRFSVTAQGATPLLVLEITSPSTRDIDLNEKVDLYRRAGVPFYAIADYRSDVEPVDLHLFGYRLTPEGYVRVSEDDRGWLWLPSLRVWLAGVDGLVRCYDEAGVAISSHKESLQEAREVKARLEQMEGEMEGEIAARHEAQRDAREATERAAAVEARLADALAELGRLKGRGNEEAGR